MCLQPCGNVEMESGIGWQALSFVYPILLNPQRVSSLILHISPHGGKKSFGCSFAVQLVCHMYFKELSKKQV